MHGVGRSTMLKAILLHDRLSVHLTWHPILNSRMPVSIASDRTKVETVGDKTLIVTRLHFGRIFAPTFDLISLGLPPICKRGTWGWKENNA